MDQKKEIKKKWLAYSVGGLLLVGFGMSLFGEAVILKYENNSFYKWFAVGTLSLICINAGISIFGQAVVYKIKIVELREEKHLR